MNPWRSGNVAEAPADATPGRRARPRLQAVIPPLPVGERGRRGAEADLDHRADDDVMGRDEAGLDEAAVEGDEARLERRRAGREAAPAAGRKPRLAGKPRARPAKASASARSETASVLTQNTPFSASARAERPAASMQTRSEAGLSVTGATAVAVNPARPAGPSVVTTWTEAATRLMPSRKRRASTTGPSAPAGGGTRGGTRFSISSSWRSTASSWRSTRIIVGMMRIIVGIDPRHHRVSSGFLICGRARAREAWRGAGGAGRPAC